MKPKRALRAIGNMLAQKEQVAHERYSKDMNLVLSGILPSLSEEWSDYYEEWFRTQAIEYSKRSVDELVERFRSASKKEKVIYVLALKEIVLNGNATVIKTEKAREALQNLGINI